MKAEAKDEIMKNNPQVDPKKFDEGIQLWKELRN
jgi:hypothetical protein